ncbi:MAG: efflux RND transporter permease subunit [Eubacteriales bacterium]|nr:efflux RND transporter permease subunit [Eubacteriales bacterium]
MAKFSVKKPFTVLVGVILALVLGVVSLVRMPTDLLPTISLPYLMVITSYPGASPEQVETDLTAPLEAALGTINGVKNVTSTSSENVSMVMLEFSQDTNMDSAMVKATTKLNQLADTLPDRASTPTLMEISADMMATEYLAVDYAGMDIYQLSDYVSQTVIPAMERVDGVARVDAVGLVEKRVEVTLNQEKIDKVNDKLLAQVSDRLAEAQEKLDKAQAELDKGQKQLNAGKAQLNQGQQELKDQQASIADQLNDMIDAVTAQIPQLEGQLDALEGRLDEASLFLENLGSRLGDLAGDLNTGEEGAFAALHAAIGENAPDWYAANAGRLPWSVEEILADESKLEALIEGLEAARDGAAQEDEALSQYEQALRQAQSDLAAVDARLEDLAAQLDVAKHPAPELQTDEATGETVEVYPPVDEALVSQLEAALSQAKSDRETLAAALAELEGSRPQSRDVSPEAFDRIIALLQEAQQFKALLETADETLSHLSGQLQELNRYREELVDALRDIQENPLDASLGDAAAQLILSGVQAQLSLGQMQISSGEAQMQSGQTQLDTAREEYEAAREEALKNANLDQLLNMQSLAQLIGAQNFSMPAGYIRDGADKLLLKVGDSFESVEELAGSLLCTMEGVGDVRLIDVADIAVTDDSQDSYAKVGGNQAVLLTVYKSSTASTSDVSDGCNESAAQLMEKDGNLHLTPIMDQGEYIRLIISTVMSNLIQGACLAIIVLIFFLKDMRPTLVVAISIPLSVLVALVAMYFTGITLNMISLSGLALGIGMLVDNSIVVIENIYRLRSRDIPAARAAVQGTRQVAGSIISSTVTTICVFLPMLFTSGLVRQLMTDLAMTITFSLLASLAVAMTVVPCAGSTVLKKSAQKSHPWFDKILFQYERLLRLCLDKKALSLLLAVVLMVGCIWQVTRMGLVMIPEISSNQVSVQVTVPEGTAREDAYAAADAVMEAAMAVPGIETVGAMSGGAGSLMGGSGGTGDNLEFSYFIVLDDQGGRDQKAVEAALLEKTKDLPCTVTVAGGSMGDASALMGSGVEVDIYGTDLDTLLLLSDRVADLLAEIPGIADISNGQEEGDRVVKIVVDKDEAMRLGLTVAQVYMELSQALATDTTSTTLTAGGESYTVSIIDTTKLPELSHILDHEFTTQTMDTEGKTVKSTHTLGEFAHMEDARGVASISRENLSRLIKVTSSTQEGYNTALLSRQVREKLDTLEVPEGYSVALAGETSQVNEMVSQMALMMGLSLLLIYLVMVAQFQSLLSPFIVLFTVPLAFTGGLLALIIAGETISMMSLMGFLILMGVVVNNGIVFVDYTNQLRLGGLPRREALVAAGKTRMRPILMTTLTTVLSMVTMLFSRDPGSEMGKGMAIVIVGGLLYATVMTLVIVPVMYEIFFKKTPVQIDVGTDLDDLPDDAAELLAQMQNEG